MKKTICIVLALLFIVAPVLSGCTQEEVINYANGESVGSAFLASWAKGQYTQMFALLTADSLIKPAVQTNKNQYAQLSAVLFPENIEYSPVITQEEFVARFDKIYDGLRIYKTEIVEQIPEYTSDGIVIAYDIKYFSEVVEELTFYDLKLDLRLNEATQKWEVEWNDNLIFPDLKDGYTLRLERIAQSRGEIFTSDGALVAQNGHAWTVLGVPSKIDEENVFAAQIAPLLGVPTEDIIRGLHSDAAKRDGVAILKVYRPNAVTTEFLNTIAAIQGTQIDKRYYSPVREYPYGSLMAHILGYTTEMQAEEADYYKALGYSEADRIGKKGLESSFESELAGACGYRLNVYDEKGEFATTIWEKLPQNGVDLQLTINMDMQRTLEAKLAELCGEEWSGNFLVMDPKTGYIEAMGSAPSFDPNIFSYPIASADWDAIANDKKNPMFTRFASGLYPPGSTIKPFVAALAMQEGLYGLNSVFPYASQIQENSWKPTHIQWYYPAIRRSAWYPGEVNMSNAIIYSDNIFFAYAAMQLGEERVVDFYKKLGFAEEFPFDITVLKSKISNNGGLADIKLLADVGYGQGELLISPVQLAALFSVFANNGNMIQPRLVQSKNKMDPQNIARYETLEEYGATYMKENVISSSIIAQLIPVMNKVTTIGTAKGMNITGMSLASKTGTAEIGPADDRQHISWYIGYVSDGSMDRLVCVTLEVSPGEADSLKLQLAKTAFLYEKPENEIP